MTKDLLEQIEQDIDDRQEWASKQALYYKMRNGGLGRGKLPFPGAADLSYPLSDTMIEKLKPAYIDQMYGGETIATFVSLKNQDQELTTGIGGWFDYNIKQQSNFERAMYSSIDQMLECGFCPVKVYWDADTKRLAFEQVDPLHLIVPKTTEEYNESGGADRIVHVIHMSVEQYKANPNFTQDEALIKRIKGKGTNDSGLAKRDIKNWQEGINCSANEHEVVLWEVYRRDRKANKITVDTISPLLPADENEVRKQFALPYNKGCFAQGDHFPFFRLRTEIKGKGYYSPRGIVEINAKFEASLTHSWNNIHDHLSFSARPNFENTGTYAIPSGKNFKNGPGGILPPGLKMAVHPPVPSGIREDMELTRSLAEDRNQVPNYSASEHLTGQVPKSQTATGQNLIAAQSGQGTNMRARVFKMDMALGLKMAHSIYLQCAVNDAMQYLSGVEAKTVDPAAFHDEYDITPNGSGDSWNKGALVQKRTGYYQMLQPDPYVNKSELTKYFMEAEDPAMVRRLWIDPQTQTANESEDQAVECLLMAAGYPAAVEPADDDKTHLQTLAAWVQDKIQRVEMTPEIAKLALDHGIGHMGQLKEKKDPALKQVEAQLKPVAEMLAMISAQPGPPPKNIVPMSQPNLQQPTGADQSQMPMQAAQPEAAAPLSQ